MTNEQKSKIEKLHRKGWGYRRISAEIGLSANTVKSFLSRITEKNDNKSFCMNYGTEVMQTKGRKQKKFCSDKCRMHYWNVHPDEMNLKNAVTIKCEICGKNVLSYRKKVRRYCSRACAAKGRVCHE